MRGRYVHVPYCAARRGYCDFNTYVAPAAERAGFAALAAQEIALAARAWPGPPDLGLRLREGLALDGQDIGELVATGLIDLVGDRAVLTDRGRLVADRVTLALTG